MTQNELPEVGLHGDGFKTEGSIYSFIKDLGVFGLLRPALVCCERDRPDSPAKYVAEFLAGSIEAL